MARVLVSEKSRNNPALQDLSPVLREVTEDKQDWIYLYCARKKLGEAIYADFIKYNKAAMGSENTFMFSADMREDGILSLTQGFQVIAAALESFELDKNRELGKEAKNRIIQLLDKLFSMITTEDGHYRFDATPYLPDSTHFSVDNCKYAYIDSLTWVISALLSAFRLHIKGIHPLDNARMEKAKDIYIYCINYLLRSFISGDDSTNQFTSGWNYTTGCRTPSLYFTFAVSEIMIDILDTFENVVRTADIELLQAEIDRKLGRIADPEEIAMKKTQVELNYAEQLENYNSNDPIYVREKALFVELNQQRSVYADDSPYKLLEDNVKKAAENIWRLVKNGIGDSFYAGNLVAKLSEDVIEQSIQSDALFNTIFVINTVVNAGLDEDREDQINYFTLNGSQEYEDALVEFDSVRDALRIAYDNVYQFYNKLNKKKKAYKINEYTLTFDEDFKGREEQVKELRKAHIRVFSLMPLLVKTKTTLGEFVIRYPQYDMQLYLENILNFRCVRKSAGLENDYYWTWERDGYSSSSNYYFVSALNDFYNYYETYEQSVSKNATKNKAERDKIRQNHLLELEKSTGVIGVLRQEKQAQAEQLQQLDAKYQMLEAKYAALQEEYANDPLRKTLNKFVLDIITQQLKSQRFLGEILDSLSDSLTASAMERVARKAENASNIGERVAPQRKWYNTPDSQDGEQVHLEAGLRKFGMALLSERLLEMMYEDHRTRQEVEEDFNGAAARTAWDIQQALRYYMMPIASGQQSEYTSTEGYRGLPDLLQDANARKNKSSK